MSQGNVTDEILGAQPWMMLVVNVSRYPWKDRYLRYRRYHSYPRYTEIMNEFTFQNCCFRTGREQILMNIWNWQWYDVLRESSQKELTLQVGEGYWSMNCLDLILEVTIFCGKYSFRAILQSTSLRPLLGFHGVIQSYDGSPICRSAVEVDHFMILSNVDHLGIEVPLNVYYKPYMNGKITCSIQLLHHHHNH